MADEITIGSKAIKEIQDLRAELIKLSSDAVNAQKSLSTISTPSGLGKSTSDNSKTIADLDKIKTKYAEVSEVVVKNAEKSRLAEIKLQQAREKSFDSFEKNAKKEQALLEKNNSVYNKTQSQINTLTKAYNDLAVRKERYNNLSVNEEMRLKTLQSVTEKYNGVLKSTDAQIGKNQRNVGNYASGYNALGNSISQLSREMPAFANSAQTGFMAISNNIPAFQDAIMGMRNAGMSWGTILKETGKSLFGLTGMISIATTALVVLGPKIIDWITGTEEAEAQTKRLTEALKKQNDQLAENLKGIKYQEQIDLALAKRAGASADALSKISGKAAIDQVDAAKKVTQSIEDQMFAMRAYINLGGVKEKFDFLMRRNGNDKAKADKELFRREVTYTEENYALLKDAREKAYKEEKELRDASVLQNIEANTEIKKENDDRLKDLAEMNKAELLLQLTKNEAILNDEDKYYSDRIVALNRDVSIRKQIAILDYNEDVRLAKDNQEKKKTAFINYQIEIFKLTQDYTKKRADLEKLDLDSITQLTNLMSRKDLLKELEKSTEKAGKELEKSGEKAEKLRLKLLELKAASNNFARSFTDEFASNSGFDNLLASLDPDDPNSLYSKIKAGNAFSKENWKATTVDIMESAQEMYNFLNQNSEANFNKEKQRAQSQYDVSLKYAGDNKEAQEKLSLDLEAKKKDIANREAKAKQKQAIFNIAIDTAQAIIGLWAKPGFPAAIPLAIAVGALGAAQIGMVASQEIPQYWMGGTHDGGLMMVNDGLGSNYKETIVTPDGKIMQPTGRNVIMDAPAGTEIFTHDMWQSQLQDMLQGKGILMSNSNQYHGITKSDLYDVMSDTLGNQPQYHSNFDANGATDYIIKGGNKTILRNNRGNGRGSKF